MERHVINPVIVVVRARDKISQKQYSVVKTFCKYNADDELRFLFFFLSLSLSFYLSFSEIRFELCAHVYIFVVYS